MDPLPDKDALTTLLSVESLLLAASTLAVTISRAPVYGDARSDLPRRVAWAIFWLVLLASVGAAAAWIELFICGDGPGNFLGWCEAVAIAAVIAALPVISGLIAKWAR
jgi:hypothetical protein